MSLQTSISDNPRRLFGVYMGRGGSVDLSHPAAAKIGLVRPTYAVSLREAKLNGWLELEPLEEIVVEKSAKEVLDHVSSDVVLRAKR